MEEEGVGTQPHTHRVSVFPYNLIGHSCLRSSQLVAVVDSSQHPVGLVQQKLCSPPLVNQSLSSGIT